jgi:hypothetical protein
MLFGRLCINSIFSCLSVYGTVCEILEERNIWIARQFVNYGYSIVWIRI